MRSTASFSPSRDTSMVWPLAWIMVVGVGHDGDMALPEHQVAAPQPGKIRAGIERLAEVAACMSESRSTSLAGHAHRQLHQAGTVDAEAGGAAPEIGRAEKRLGHRDIVGGDFADRPQMAGDERLAGGQQRIVRAARFRSTRHRHRRPHRQLPG